MATTTNVPVYPVFGVIVNWLPETERATGTAVFVAPVSSAGLL